MEDLKAGYFKCALNSKHLGNGIEVKIQVKLKKNYEKIEKSLRIPHFFEFQVKNVSEEDFLNLNLNDFVLLNFEKQFDFMDWILHNFNLVEKEALGSLLQLNSSFNDMSFSLEYSEQEHTV
ncbi:hypothetical protein HK099_006357 [Clydaea vesicula]|uniref:Uncharacterized protein n=1 Tax=Clydaea vesicula TaxID=447962 RepID=A0AAD5XYA7_9FUNG|nr:hypothetical protein HK099_006357 [Clydaea vesicula]